MIGMTLDEMMGGGEAVDLRLESDEVFRRRVLVVCDDSDMRAVEIAAGFILDDLAANYDLARRYE